MNLGRAKTILVIAFAGLNLFLGYHLFWPDFGRLTKVAVTAEDVRATEAILDDNNFTLETTLDRSIQVSDFLTVTPAIDYQGEILQHFIKKGAGIAEYEGMTAYRADTETAVVYSSGLVRIIYEPGVLLDENSIILSSEQIGELVTQFLEEEQLMPPDVALDNVEVKSPDYVTVYFHQIYEGAPIFAGQLTVTVESNYIIAVEVYMLTTVERVPAREVEVISATEALTNLVEALGPSSDPRIIKDIELGYYSGEYEAEKWEIPPVWRVVLDNHEYHYINAFTGNIEQDTVIPEQLP